MSTDLSKLELQLKAHEKSISAMQRSVEDIRKTSVDPGLGKRLAVLENSIKDLEKRVLRLFTLVEPLVGGALVKETAKEVEAMLSRQFVSKSDVEQELKVWGYEVQKKDQAVLDRMMQQHQAKLDKHRAQADAAVEAKIGALSAASLKEVRREAKEAAMEAYKSAVATRIHAIETKVDALMSRLK